MAIPVLGPQIVIAATAGSFHDLAVHTPLPGGGFAVLSLQETGPESAQFRLQLRDGLGHPWKVVDLGGLEPAGFSAIPRLIAGADGTLALAWTSADRAVWVQCFTAEGEALAGPTQISPLGRVAELDDLVHLPSGGFAASWTGYTADETPSANDWNVHLAQFDAGGAPELQLRLNARGALAENASRLAFHEDGSFTALWLATSGADGTRDLMLRRFAADGTPLAREEIVAADLSYPTDPTVLALANGSVLLSYAEWIPATDPAQLDVKQARFVILDGSGNTVLFDHVPQTTHGNIWDAKALQLQDGRLLLSWAEPANDGVEVVRKAVVVGTDLALSEPVSLIAPQATWTPGFGLMELADGRIAVSWTVPDPFGATDTALQFLDPRQTGVTLTAGDAAVVWVGSRFADQMTGGAGADTVNGGRGADTLTGGDAADRLRGGNGADVLSGGAGDDQLSGGQGRDRLTGGSGADRLSGGAAADVFVLSPADGSDHVTDFETGRDRLDLTAFHFATAEAALSHWREESGGLRLDHDGGGAFLAGVTLAMLSADDLIV